MSVETKAKHTGLFILLCIGVFLLFTLIGVVSKIAYDPSHGKYSVKWDDSMGTVFTDIPYGNGGSNKFDLYLPADNTKENYGLAVYLHAGGFTTGDKSDDTLFTDREYARQTGIHLRIPGEAIRGLLHSNGAYNFYTAADCGFFPFRKWVLGYTGIRLLQILLSFLRIFQYFQR